MGVLTLMHEYTFKGRLHHGAFIRVLGYEDEAPFLVTHADTWLFAVLAVVGGALGCVYSWGAMLVTKLAKRHLPRERVSGRKVLICLVIFSFTYWLPLAYSCEPCVDEVS